MEKKDIGFKTMADYVCTYDILNARSESNRKKDAGNRRKLLTRDIPESIVDKICLMARIRHIYHVEQDILFMNKKHIKDLKTFIRSLNEDLKKMPPQLGYNIESLVIDKSVYNNIDTENVTQFHDIMEAFNINVKKWLVDEIEAKTGVVFISDLAKENIESAKNRKKHEEFIKLDMKRLEGKKRVKTDFKLEETDIEEGMLNTNYTNLLDEKTSEYMFMSTLVIRIDIVDMVIKSYRDTFSKDQIPNDLSYFNSDNIYAKSTEMIDAGIYSLGRAQMDKIELARYLTSLELSEFMKAGLENAINYRFLPKRSKKLSFVESGPSKLICSTIGRLGLKEENLTLNNIHKCVLEYPFTLDRIENYRYGRLFNLKKDVIVDDFLALPLSLYTYAIAGAVKICIPYLMDLVTNLKWNGKSLGITEEKAIEILSRTEQNITARVNKINFKSILKKFAKNIKEEENQ